MLMSTIVFADTSYNPKELDAVLIESLSSISDIHEASSHVTFAIDKVKLKDTLLLSGYIQDGDSSEYIEIKGNPFKSYYTDDLVVKVDSSNSNWKVEYFASVSNTPYGKIFFNTDVTNKNSIQIILKNSLTNKVIIVEDLFCKLSKELDKNDWQKTIDPFLEHWWTRVLQPSSSFSDSEIKSRSVMTDFDSFYSSRYDLGSGYWAEYYIKVEQTSRFYDLSSVGSTSNDTLALSIVDEETTTNYWGYDDLNVTPLVIKNARGEYKISASYGTTINDEFTMTDWGGQYYDQSNFDFTVSASIGKIISASINYQSISNIRYDDTYIVPTSLGPAGGFKATFPGYLDCIGNQYNMIVTKERSDQKNTDYFMQGTFYFDYAMDYGTGSLASGSTFTIGEYQ